MQAESTPLWKIVLGVALGVLLADLVRMAFAALALGAVVGSWGVTTYDPGKITERVRVDLPTQTPELPALPGPVEARSSGISRACINGTIVDRSGNGWEQALSGSRPQVCRATSE